MNSSAFFYKHRITKDEMFKAVSILQIVIISSMMLMLSGCIHITPLADPNALGIIEISDPKLFTRESLIAERERDVKWIEHLLVESENPSKITFDPEIERIVKKDSYLSTDINFKLDPLLTPNESDINLESKKEANKDSDKYPKSFIKNSPLGDFRDRSAYRDILKSAQNSAGLDLLHDYPASDLIRLNFQATVIPADGQKNDLGVIQVHVEPYEGDKNTQNEYLHKWLIYLNSNEEYRIKSSNFRRIDRINSVIKRLLKNGWFQIVKLSGVELLLPVEYLYEMDKFLAPIDIIERITKEDNNEDENESEDENKDYLKDLFGLYSDDVSKGIILNNLCGINNPSDTSIPSNSNLLKSDFSKLKKQSIKAKAIIRRLINIVKINKATNSIRSEYDHIYLEVKNNLELLDVSSEGESADESDESDESEESGEEIFLKKFIKETLKKVNLVCSTSYKEEIENESSHEWVTLLGSPFSFNNRIRVYEIGPREQTQHASTDLHFTDNLLLAASIASGLSNKVGLSSHYYKQISELITARERVPSVVGFSRANERMFGWIIGPQVMLDSEGKIKTEQLLKTYDLSVDLSIPSWWHSLSLNIETHWTSNSYHVYLSKLNIPLRHISEASSNYDALTKYLTEDEAKIEIKEIYGNPINICAESKLILIGDNIWRAKKVFVLGRVLDIDKITITPDMKGIILTIPPIKSKSILNERLDKHIYVMTPLGMTEGKKIDIIASPLSKKECAP